MKPLFVLPLAVAGCLPFASPSHADTYTETGDAGEVPLYAQLVQGTPYAPLTSITGQTILNSGIADGDLYLIYVNNPGAFSASLTAFAPGANNFDSQLALFNMQGNGVETNDDDASGTSSQSSLPTGNTLLSAQGAGFYYLLVNGSGRYAVDGTGNLIFPNYTDNTTDPTGTYGPNVGSGALTGYTGNSSEAGNYVIALTGAEVVPEPSTYASVLAGVTFLGLVMRARRATA